MGKTNMPHGEDRIDGNGYVVYDDSYYSHNVQWESARLRQKEKVENWYSLISNKPTIEQYKAVGQYLISLGTAEQEKEKALMKAVLGTGFDDTDDEKLLINQFNYAIVGKKQYEDALKRIKIGLSSEGGSGSGLAPAISSLFAGKLNTIFGKKINELIARELKDAKTGEQIDAAISRMEEKIVKIYKDSIDLAFKETLTYQNKGKVDDKYGSLKGYQELYDLYKSNPIFEKIFKESIGKLFNIEKVIDIIRNNRTKIKENKLNGKNMTGAKWANEALSLRVRTGQIGGSVNETINMLRDSFNDVTIDENGSRTARQIISNKLKTDNVIIFQADIVIDQKTLDEGLAKLSKEMDATKNLIEANKVIEKYWQDNLSKLDDGFVVFKSGKSYGLNNISNYGGFKGSEKYSIGNLKDFPKSPSLSNTIDMDKFIIVIANTIQGGALAKNYNNVREWLYMYITESIASLLFDDWERIGTDIAKGKGPNAIHVLTLEDINIPISVFLIGAGKALIDAVDNAKRSTNFIKMTLHKSELKYPDEDSYKKDPDTWDPEAEKPLVARAWRKQRADALQNYSITVQFYKNFNEEVLNKILNGQY